MKITPERNRNDKGFTLIETIVGVAIFAMVSLTLFELFGVVFKNIRNNKAVMTANSLALEQLEIVRGMEFNDVKTDTGWVPAGLIPSQRNLKRDGVNYLVRTDVSWTDDPYDGTDDSDTFPYDYKKIRVRVSWVNPVGGATNEVAMSTSVVPEGLEGLSPGKGGLYLSVFNSGGSPIADADITVNSSTAAYSLAPAGGGRTDVNGNIWIPDLTPADDYHISVTKSGYSTAETYAINNDPSSLDYNPSPEKRNAIVISQKAVKVGFQIDVLGSMNIKTVHFENPANWKTNADSTGEQTEVSAVAGGGDVFVAWADTRDTEKHIYLQRLSYSGGNYARSWSSDVMIVGQPNASMPRMAILPDGSLYVVWSDNRNGDSDIYMQRFNTANGSAVGSEYAVSHAASGTSQNNPDMASDQDGNLYIAWEDNRDGDWDIYGQKLTLSSSDLWGSDLKINSVAAGDQLGARVVVDRDNTGGVNASKSYVVWQGSQAGNFDIFMRKFDKDGTPQFVEKMVNSDGGSVDQYEPSVVFDGSNNLYIAWSDDRNAQPDIYMQKTDKEGIAAWAGDAKINDDSYASARRSKSSISYVSDSAIYVSWEDNRNGDTVSNIYTSKIDFAAARQWTYDLIVADVLDSMQTDVFTTHDASGRAVTLWQDNRNGNNDIYGATYTEMGNYTRSGIPIQVISQKNKGTYKDTEGNDVPIPKYVHSFTSDSAGNIVIDSAQGGLEWGNYTFLAGSPYEIISIDLPSPIYVAPGGVASVVINVGP